MKEVSVGTSARQVEMFVSNVPHSFCIWDYSEKYVAPYYCKTLFKVEEREGTSTFDEVCFHIIFFNWYSGGGVQLGPLGTAATNGLLCQPRVIMMMEKLVE
jgi:hypothetical protein